jgi:hypothetical protein
MSTPAKFATYMATAVPLFGLFIVSIAAMVVLPLAILCGAPNRSLLIVLLVCAPLVAWISAYTFQHLLEWSTK